MACNCIVIVREVWDTRDLAGALLDPSGALKPGALSSRMEPEDLNALEMALRVKDQQGGTVSAVAIGDPRDVDVLRECLYRGADSVHRIAAGASTLDTQAAAALYAAAVRQLGGADLVLAGVTLAEGENSLLGSHVAALLGLEQVSYVDSLEKLEGGSLVARRAIEMGYEDVEVSLPALLTVGVALVEDDPRTPRSAKAMLKLKAKKAEIPVLAAASLAPVLPTAVKIASRQAVPERVVESIEVDPENETALKAMLDAVLKGE